MKNELRQSKQDARQQLPSTSDLNKSGKPPITTDKKHLMETGKHILQIEAERKSKKK